MTRLFKMKQCITHIGLKSIFIFMIGVLSLVSVASRAQTVRISAPSHVSTGENFRLSYIINTNDIDEYRAGNIPQGLELIAGPYTSSQYSFQMVNGHTSRSSSETITYTLYAAKAGSYTLPALHAKVNGKWISSRTARVVVSGGAPSSNNAPKLHEDDTPSHMASAGTAISGKDLFIKVSANKRRVHEQEPVLLTYKVYTLVDLTQLEGKMPDLTGFHTQEVQLPQQKSFHIENVGGRNYRCVTWSQYVMYPQMTGKLQIPAITFKGIVVQQNRTVDPMEAFLNGGSGYVEVKRNIVAPGVTIQVDPLPQRPAGFSGGVGKFNITAQLDKNSVKAGNPLNLRVVISGIGNLKLIKQPDLKVPKDFDKYDAKITDKTKLTANGVEGNMVYDFLIVPRNEGKYTIPAIDFIYYDTQLNQYRTEHTQPFNITVEKGEGRSSSTYTDTKDKDIHQIMTGSTELHPIDEFFFGSVAFWVWLLIPLITFVVLLVVFRKRALENADVVKMRGKKANRVATRRLRHARDLMFKGKQGEFYDEVLRALWGYVSDKLNIPVESLSRDNISEKLKQQDVSDVTVQKFLSALDECEFERFAPGDPIGNMGKTFESAMSAIMEIEDTMKKHKKTAKASATVVLLFLLMLPMTASAVTKQIADAEYLKGNYQQAIKDYQELLKHGVSAEVYYNLGNAYFRSQDIPHAVLNYERASMLSPGNKDIRFNLEFARSRTIDQIAPSNEMFFVTWYHALVNFTSVDNWAYLAIFSIIAALILMLVYLFGQTLLSRKTGFYGGAAFLLLFVLSCLFAYQQKDALKNRHGAIVMSSAVNVKKTPSASSEDAFILHEGTRVDITDKTMRNWRGIKVGDGREGWIKTSQIEEI